MDMNPQRVRTAEFQTVRKGLDPADKSVKVANFCKNIVHEVEVISHSCGVGRPRQLKRKHVRIVQPHGKSIPMDELFPRPDVLPQYTTVQAAE